MTLFSISQIFILNNLDHEYKKFLSERENPQKPDLIPMEQLIKEIDEKEKMVESDFSLVDFSVNWNSKSNEKLVFSIRNYFYTWGKDKEASENQRGRKRIENTTVLKGMKNLFGEVLMSYIAASLESLMILILQFIQLSTVAFLK